MDLFYIVEHTTTGIHYIAGPFGSQAEAIQGKAQLALTTHTKDYTIVHSHIEVTE